MGTNYLPGRAAWLLSAAVILVSLTIGTAEAGPKGKKKGKGQERKVTICHLAKGSGVFKPISISPKAARRHLRKHDDQLPNVEPGDGSPTLDEECFVTSPPVPVVARAYIDANPRDGGYNRRIDPNIATVYDSDDTPGLSAGDSIEFGEYPASYEQCPTRRTCETRATNLTGQTVTIKEVNVENATTLILTLNTPPSDSSLPEYTVNIFTEGHPTRGDYELLNIDGLDGTELELRDSHDPITRELIICQYLVAGDPQICTEQYNLPALTRPSNDPFLEVEIY